MYMYQMSAVDMTTDAALLDEMSSLLDSNLLVLTHTPRGFSPYDDGFKASMFPINLDAFSAGCTGSPLPLDCYSTTTGRTPDASLSDDSIAHKRQIRKEKEALRKQRYQRRLKNERETLRCMAKELPSRLAALQHTRKSKKIGSPATELAPAQSAWRDAARKERAQRRRSEVARKKLADAVAVQTKYLSALRGLVPNQAADADAGVPKPKLSVPGLGSTEECKEATGRSIDFAL
jgi:hypothetical protein